MRCTARPDHSRHGRLDTALVLFQAALKADLGRADGFASLGLVFHALKQFKQALNSYDGAFASRPATPSFSTGAAWRCSSLAGRARRWKISNACWRLIPIISMRSAIAATR